MSTPVVAGLVVVGIAVWWFGEYRSRGGASRWPPLSGLWLLPAAVFRVAVRAMWANRWLALCLLLISWLSVVERNAALQRLMAESRRAHPSAGGIGVPGGSLLDFGGSVLRDPGWVRQLLPRISEDLYGASYGPLIGVVLLGAFAVVMLLLICRPPAWLPDSDKQAAVWPMLVSLLGAVVFAIRLLDPYPVLGSVVPPSSFLHSVPVEFATALLMPFALGPVSAALLSLVHQAVTEGVARMSPALQASVRAWPQVGAMWLLLTWPTALFLISAGAPRGGAGESSIDPMTMVWALQAVWQWAVVLVAFLPWVLLESRLQFWPAVIRHRTGGPPGRTADRAAAGIRHSHGAGVGPGRLRRRHRSCVDARLASGAPRAAAALGLLLILHGRYLPATAGRRRGEGRHRGRGGR